jgi:hypothetical protein
MQKGPFGATGKGRDKIRMHELSVSGDWGDWPEREGPEDDEAHAFVNGDGAGVVFADV